MAAGDIVKIIGERVLFLKDTKPNGIQGGGFTASSWQTRDLNFAEGDLSFATFPANFFDNDFDNNGSTPDVAEQRFTLETGKYHIWASAMAHAIFKHKIKLANISDVSDAILGSSSVDNNVVNELGYTFLEGEIVIAAPKVFALQHFCSVTRATDGFGLAAGFSVIEVYAQMMIKKIA